MFLQLLEGIIHILPRLEICLGGFICCLLLIVNVFALPYLFRSLKSSPFTKCVLARSPPAISNRSLSYVSRSTSSFFKDSSRALSLSSRSSSLSPGRSFARSTYP